MQEVSENHFSEIRDGTIFRLPQTAAMDIEWIREGLKKPGKSQVGLAKAMGRSPSMVTSLLNGTRELKVKEIGTIARYLEIRAPDRATEDSTPYIAYLMIRGEVAGGVWSEPGLEFERIPTKIPVDPRWPLDKTYLLRVRGTSINRKAKDGDLVVCLDAYAAPRKYQPGDWVIAERERNGMVETTVKRVGVDANGEWILLPDSDDRQFQEPISLGDTQHENVRVLAFVLQFVSRATDF